MEGEINMFNTIEELVTEAIADGGYDAEFTEALKAELEKLDSVGSRLLELEEDSMLLNALTAAGVDNWEGYSYAQELMWEEE